MNCLLKADGLGRRNVGAYDVIFVMFLRMRIMIELSCLACKMVSLAVSESPSIGSGLIQLLLYHISGNFCPPEIFRHKHQYKNYKYEKLCLYDNCSLLSPNEHGRTSPTIYFHTRGTLEYNTASRLHETSIAILQYRSRAT